MEWYIPITIIPGIGLIIVSTSNILLELNIEITTLQSAIDENIQIIKLKLVQLKILSISIVFQYLGVLFFLLSGVSSSLFTFELLPKYLLLTGVGLLILSIILLLAYSIKAVSIRQKHLKTNLKNKLL